MTQTEGDASTGIVATDNKNNEWVWVEVPQSIYTTAKSDTDYTNIYNDMKTYSSSYSEVFFDTDDCYIFNSGHFSSETAYNNEKNRMLKSVYDNGGFWISRYEIGTTNASQSVAKNTTNVTTPVSQQNAYPIVNKTQPQSQQIVRKMNSQANLLFGVQWDLTLKFLEVNRRFRGIATLTNDSTSWGNYWNASFTINRGKYQAEDDWSSSSTSWTNATNVSKPSDDWWKLTTGAADRNCKMNIYDLAGNVLEWTLESHSASDAVGSWRQWPRLRRRQSSWQPHLLRYERLHLRHRVTRGFILVGLDAVKTETFSSAQSDLLAGNRDFRELRTKGENMNQRCGT